MSTKVFQNFDPEDSAEFVCIHGIDIDDICHACEKDRWILKFKSEVIECSRETTLSNR